MHVNYFDFGLCSGEELHWMVNHYFPSLGVDDYSAYGFEASYPYWNNLNQFFSVNDNVSIIHGAISEKHGEDVRLYHSPNTVGHSIFSTKNDVLLDDYENIRGIVFSEWLRENKINLNNSLNVLKANIEGAEYFLYKDIVESGLRDHFSIFLGTGHDINKVKELKDSVAEFEDLLTDNNIEILRYTEWKPERNVDVVALIDGKLSELE